MKFTQFLLRPHEKLESRAYAGDLYSIRAGTCAIKILEKKVNSDGEVESFTMIYKSSRSKPLTLTLYKVRPYLYIGNTGGKTDVEIEMHGDQNGFGIQITPKLTVFATILGMDGDRHCEHFEENPMTDEEFENY